MCRRKSNSSERNPPDSTDDSDEPALVMHFGGDVRMSRSAVTTVVIGIIILGLALLCWMNPEQAAVLIPLLQGK